MKKLLTIPLMLGLILVSAQFAFADGATVIKDDSCVIIAADWGGPFSLFSDDMISVETPSGNLSMKCFFTIPEGEEPDKAVKFSGFNCGTYAGTTTDTMSVVTPGGNVMLDCKVKPDPNP